VYGYPADLAARIAIDTVRNAVLVPSMIKEVLFCCFSRNDLELYSSFLAV
jgi:O-acetyl-ADP-ribose deacetylase (regulator of RNase III)